VLNYSLHILGL